MRNPLTGGLLFHETEVNLTPPTPSPTKVLEILSLDKYIKTEEAKYLSRLSFSLVLAVRQRKSRN